MSHLKHVIEEATKAAMKARDKARVATLRMVNAEIKRLEVDERRDLTEEDVLGILNKMLKQRQDAESQFTQAGREDLALQEAYEITIVQEFLPEQMSEEELGALIDKIVTDIGASGMQSMGNVMAELKATAGGRADMSRASALVKARLS
jgi:uncharacterized protein YqeY